MSEPKSFKRLDFHIDGNAKLINKVKPFIIHSTSVYIPLNQQNDTTQMSLIEFAEKNNIPISDINILLKNDISTIEKLSNVGISFLKTLNLSNIQAILNALGTS